MRKKNIFLIIRTDFSDKIVLGLSQEEMLISQLTLPAKKGSEKLLFAIDKLLTKHKVKPKELAGIFIVKGPGSYTSLKIGCAVANIFAFVLKIPALGFKKDKFQNLKELSKLGFKKYKSLRKKNQARFVFPFYGEPAYYQKD